MNLRLGLVIVLALGLVGWLAATGLADDEGPSEEEMMKKMMELATPGPFHEHLKPLAGKWNVHAAMSDGMESNGVADVEWILGNRFLEVKYQGSWGGMPFEGRGLMGYDNFKKEYQSMWTDTWSSGFMVETGTCSDDGKTITFTGDWDGPMGEIEMKDVYTIGTDSYKLTSYWKDEEGAWAQKMVLSFTRKK